MTPRIELWHLRPADMLDDDRAERFRTWLSPQEHTRQGRWHFDKDRRRDLLTRGLLRSVLSRHAPVHPADWRFTVNDFGRPAIDPAHGLAGRLDFNLSHADAHIVLAVTPGITVGIDVEPIDRQPALALADRWFTPAEAAALRALPESQQAARLLELWTLKESYLKARGMGLSLPLETFGFALDGEAQPRLQVSPQAGDPDASRWRFFQWVTPGEQLVALCVACGPAAIEIVHRDFAQADGPPFDCRPWRRTTNPP